jgi:hypothetical protein
MTCEAGYRDWLLDAYIPCTEPAASAITRICLHEHLRRLRVCAGHAEKALSGKKAICHDCIRLPGELAHPCPVTIVPADDEEGIVV